MTDNELLELAAKAVGIDPSEELNTETGNMVLLEHRWNPLIDDGDALRLAVRLNLFIDLCYPDKTCGWVGDYKSGVCKTLEEPENADPYAATRRAIVRAAADIGKEMK